MAKKHKWIDAIVRVLREERQAMHYTEIAELIAEKKYYNALGATPASTVNATINTDIKAKKDKSIFVRVGKGEYTLQELWSNNEAEQSSLNEKVSESTKLIQSFGIYWNRTEVDWKNRPDLFGTAQPGAIEVNFQEQIGIYLLHDVRETIYVGQAIDEPISVRLLYHTKHRLGGRWDRFSWYGLYGVLPDGKLNKNIDIKSAITLNSFGDTLEAILIESLEPRQNRKRGNSFDGIEFDQVIDPKFRKEKAKQLLDAMQ